MAKLPYIPIYIGDWEQDTNCISIEAEGALIKLIFKLWKSPTKGLLSISFSQIALLLKKDEENAVKIIKELQENDILNIEFLPQNKIKIESRRMLKDLAKSDVYSLNGSKGGRGKKQIKSKLKAKVKQITEYDIDNESDNINNKGRFDLSFISLELLEPYKDFLKMRSEIKKPIRSQTSLEANYKGLLKKANYKLENAKEIIEQSIANQWQGFFEIKTKLNEQFTKTSDRITRSDSVKGVANIAFENLAKRNGENGPGGY